MWALAGQVWKDEVSGATGVSGEIEPLESLEAVVIPQSTKAALLCQVGFRGSEGCRCPCAAPAVFGGDPLLPVPFPGVPVWSFGCPPHSL